MITRVRVEAGMLDVSHRSQRGRVCAWSRERGGPVLETPAVLGPAGDGDGIFLTESGRTLRLLGAEVPLDPKILTTASSWTSADPVVSDGVEVVRLPLPDGFEADPSAEVVVVPNGFELRRDPRGIVDAVTRLREGAGFGRVLCVLGLAEPSTMALLALMGVDVVDDSLCRAAGLRGLRLMPEGEADVGGDVSEENCAALRREAALVADFVRADRLRELADQRAPATPSGVALLRTYDRVGFRYAEEACPTAGVRFCCNTTQSLRRPEVVRWREAMARYGKPECKRILLLLPCSARKPYHISKSHRAFASAIHTAQHDTLVHEVIVTSPLGVVPRELDAFYPANSYDIPVTGEWKPEEREFIRGLVAGMAGRYDRVVCHLEDRELVEGIADMEFTVVGDPTSPRSLENLDRALREAAEGMQPVSWQRDRDDTMRSVLAFQFGPEAADALMEGARVAGKFPYWKILRADGAQMGMMTPERGMVSLTMEGAAVLASLGRNLVEIQDFEVRGNLFAVGVVDADPSIRIGDEAVLVCGGRVRGVGVAEMCGREMVQLGRGEAVRMRHRSKRRVRGFSDHGQTCSGEGSDSATPRSPIYIRIGGWRYRGLRNPNDSAFWGGRLLLASIPSCLHRPPRVLQPERAPPRGSSEFSFL